MADSALAGVFREYVLTYDRETGGTTTDDRGNPVPEVERAELVINFEPTGAPQIVFQEGADARIVRGTGTAISPSELPAGIGPGSEFSMEFGGIPGTLRLTQVAPAPLAVLDEVLGQEFRAEWRPSGVV